MCESLTECVFLCYHLEGTIGSTSEFSVTTHQDLEIVNVREDALRYLVREHALKLGRQRVKILQ
jgi:hypothetical protein